MSAPLPRWSDSVFRVVLIAIVGTPVVTLGGAMLWLRTGSHTDEGRALAQPIDFDHRHHVGDDGIACGYCHYDAARSDHAGVPETEVCLGCHRQIYPESPLLALVRESESTERPIHWRRVMDVPDHAHFPHAPHVLAGVGCETCHGRVDQMAAVAPAVNLHMGWCLDCHRDPEPHLRPREAVEEMGYTRPDEFVAEAVDPPLHCSGCHR